MPQLVRPPASRPWRMSRSPTAATVVRYCLADNGPEPRTGPSASPLKRRQDRQARLARRALRSATSPDPDPPAKRAATLPMLSTGALANETSQELGGSCADTRDSDVVSPAWPPDTIGPCSGGAIGAGELRSLLAGPPTISTQGNSTIPSGRGWAIGGCSSSGIRPAGHRSGASRTNSRISGSSAARRSRAAVSPRLAWHRAA